MDQFESSAPAMPPGVPLKAEAARSRGAQRAKPTERRLHGRLSCEICLNGRVGPRQASVRALDLSVTGARVVLPSELRDTREIVLSGEGLRANTNSTVRAQVVWVKPLDTGEVMAGLHFLEDPTQLESTWAHLYLRRMGAKTRQRRFHRGRTLDRPVVLHCPGKKHEVSARLVALSAGGGQVDLSLYLHLGSNLWIDIPYDAGSKHLRLMAQVVHHQKRGRGWRMSLQFLVAEEARDQVVLQHILAEEDPGEPAATAVNQSCFWT